jgi:hypothetical protein
MVKAVVEPVPNPTMEPDLTKFAAALPTSCFINFTGSAVAVIPETPLINFHKKPSN